MTDAATVLRLEARHVTFETAGMLATVAIGPRGIAEAFFRHHPPRADELERAIDAIEDALMAGGLRPAPGGTLESSPSLLTALPLLRIGAPALSRDDVERWFARLAAAAAGDPTARADVPPDAQGAAALLILRECMHHLGFDRLRIPPD